MLRDHCRPCLLTLFAGLAAAPVASAQTDVTWDGDCGIFWESFCAGGATSGWDNDQLPQPSEHAIIVDAEEVRIGSPSGQVVDRLTLVDSFLITVSSINVLSDATISNSVFNGRFESLGPVDFIGDSTFAGTMRGPGLFTNQGTLRYADGNIGDNTQAVQFDNFGTLNLSFEPSIGEGSVLSNLGTLEFVSGGIAGTGRLDNADTVRYNRTGTLAVVGCPYHQKGGTTEALAGTLRFAGTTTLEGGELTAQLGATIDFFGGFDRPFTVTAATQASGTGDVTLRPGAFGRLTLDAPLTLNVQAPGKALTQGNLTLNDDLINRGYLQFVSTRIDAGGGTIINEAGGIMETILNTSGQLATDAPLINRGVLVTLSGIGTNTNLPNSITNESGALWQMYKLPGQTIDVTNNADIVHEPLNGNPLGDGTISGRFDQNNGNLTVTIDIISLAGGGTWTGTSTASASQDGRIFFEAGQWNFNGDPTTLNATNPAAPNRAEIIFTSNATIDVAGRLVLNGSQRPQFELPPIRLDGTALGFGNLENLGYAALYPNGRLGTPSSDFATFTNKGHFIINGAASPDPTITMTTRNDALLEVRGPITIAQNPATNNETWALDNAGFALTQTVTHEFINRGTFISDTQLSDPPIETSNTHKGPFSNEGTVLVTRNTNLVFDGDVRQVENTILTGGTWIVEPDCQLIFTEPIRLVGPATVFGSTDSIPQLRDTETLDGGTIELDEAGLVTNGAMQVRNGGTLRSTNGAPINTSGLLENGLPPAPPNDTDGSSIEYLERIGGGGGRITDPYVTGIIAPQFINNATLDPGIDGAPFGLRIQADTTLSSSSLIRIDISGNSPATEYDHIIVEGPLESGGTIVVRFAPGFEPGPDDSFSVLGADSIQGTAPTVVSPSYATNKRLVARIVGNTIELGPSCAADFNADAVLDTGDIGAFIDAFLASDPVADFNGDAVLDLGDISAFVAAFLAGC